MGQEIRERFSGAVEAFSRRNNSGHGLHGDHSRHRSSDDVPSSKDVVSSCKSGYAIFLFLLIFLFSFCLLLCTLILDYNSLSPLCPFYLQQPDSERGRSSSRNGSTSKRPVISSSRPSSSAEPGENRSSRLISGSGRLSTTQRVQPGIEPKTSFTRTAAARGGRDDALRSFELLSIGTGKRK